VSKGQGMGRRYQPTRESGERREIPQLGLGQSPGKNELELGAFWASQNTSVCKMS